MNLFTVFISLVLILCLNSIVQASQCYDISDENKEIHLDYSIPSKGYNLKKNDYKNTPEIKTDEDDEIELPVNFISTPLKLLKQYQEDKY